MDLGRLSAREGAETCADLCLLVRPELRGRGFFDLLFELKLVRRKELGTKGQKLKDMDDASLRALPSVARAFAEARSQAARYRAALLGRHGSDLDLRSYAVVAVGLERMLGEEVGVAPETAAGPPRGSAPPPG